MILLLLSEDDRKRFGCDRVLEVSLVVTAREAAEMQRPFFPNGDGQLEGFTDPDEWREALRGTPMFDEYGGPVMVDQQAADGTVTKVQKRQPNFGADLALVWLTLKRAGIEVPPLRQFDFDAAGARFYPVPDDEPDGDDQPDGPGKDDDSDRETTSSG